MQFYSKTKLENSMNKKILLLLLATGSAVQAYDPNLDSDEELSRYAKLAEEYESKPKQHVDIFIPVIKGLCSGAITGGLTRYFLRNNNHVTPFTVFAVTGIIATEYAYHNDLKKVDKENTLRLTAKKAEQYDKIGKDLQNYIKSKSITEIKNDPVLRKIASEYGYISKKAEETHQALAKEIEETPTPLEEKKRADFLNELFQNVH